MKLTEEQLAEMEAQGARVIRQPGSRKQEEPVAEVAPTAPAEPAVPSVEAEALRLLVAQNSEALNAIGAALANMKPRPARDIDFEIIRDESVEGDYKPMTHVRVRRR